MAQDSPKRFGTFIGKDTGSMRIVINGRFLTQNTTGVQRYARELIEAIDNDLDACPGLSVEMLVPKAACALPSYRNIRLRRIGILSGHLWEQIELPLHFKGDVLFCPGNTAPLASLILRKRVVVTVHDLSYRYFPSAYSRAFKLAYNTIMPAVMRLAGRVITVSNAEKVQILKYYPSAATRMRVVPNGGMPAIRHATSGGSAIQKPYALYVGSFSKRKNIEGVLKVAERLLAERPDLRMVLVGGSPTIFEAVGLGAHTASDRMLFPGQIDDPEALSAYYAAAAVLIFPSFYESSGLPPVEAMASECPVVVSAIPALEERCGDAALYCDPHDVDDIHRVVCRVLDDPERADDLRRRGLERARTFTWGACAAQTLAVLRELAPANRDVTGDRTVAIPLPRAVDR